MIKALDILKPLAIVAGVDTLSHIEPLGEIITRDGHLFMRDAGYLLSLIYAIYKLYKETPHYHKRQARRNKS